MFSGIVAAVGRIVSSTPMGDGVREFKIGEKVSIVRSEIGVTRLGSFAERVAVPVESLVRPPAGWSTEESAGATLVYLTAYQAITQWSDLPAKCVILVTGASGGVGTFAVQIAKAFGAEVTGVCSTRNVELVESLGAERVVDYTVADFTAGGERYDVVLDNVGNRPLRRTLAAVTPRGTLVLNAGGSPGAVFGAVATLLRAKLLNLAVSQRLAQLPTVESRENLLTVAKHAEAGTLLPVVDRVYPLAATADAVRHVEQGHARGKVVVAVA